MYEQVVLRMCTYIVQSMSHNKGRLLLSTQQSPKRGTSPVSSLVGGSGFRVPAFAEELGVIMNRPITRGFTEDLDSLLSACVLYSPHNVLISLILSHLPTGIVISFEGHHAMQKSVESSLGRIEKSRGFIIRSLKMLDRPKSAAPPHSEQGTTAKSTQSSTSSFHVLSQLSKKIGSYTSDILFNTLSLIG